MKKIFVYGAFLLALNACKSDGTPKKDDPTPTPKENPVPTPTPSTSGGWSSADRTAFIRECTDAATDDMGASQASSYCTCMEEKLEKMYPTANDANNMTEEDMKALAPDCLK